MYSYGDLSINKSKLKNFLGTFDKGTYSTCEIIDKYQGTYYLNKKIPAEYSWNANFGKILKQCMIDTNNTIIREVDSHITDKEHNTTSSIWEII